MARLGKVASWFAALGIVALVVWAFIKGVDQDPAVVGTVFTAVAGIVVVVYQRRREKHQELERSHREQMSPIYQRFEQIADKLDRATARVELSDEICAIPGASGAATSRSDSEPEAPRDHRRALRRRAGAPH
jgi:membrane protein implicated in regulation of membrane protease activity